MKASYHELAAQAQAANALDAKLLGLLGFFAAATSLLLTLPDGTQHGRSLLLAGAAIGLISCLLGSVACATIDVGPSPERFYADHGGEPETTFLARLLGELASAAFTNLNALTARRRAIAAAIMLPLALALVYIATGQV